MMIPVHGSRKAWLERLPDIVNELSARWALSVSAPFDDQASSSWVAPAVRRDGSPAILKVGMPHMEAAHEIQGLRVWDGDAAVRLLEADEDLNAMLLERCVPGTSLRALPESEQDVVIAGLLRRLWRQPSSPHSFRPLSVMLEHWAAETLASAPRWVDEGLVREGLRLFESLSRPTEDDVLLPTDLHAGNVLRAERETWLAIDPKPFVGDCAYDATQHLLNCRRRVMTDSEQTIRRVADLFELDWKRVRRWTFARAAAEPREMWNDELTALAKKLA
jgi:streptomycin 6-kinase